MEKVTGGQYREVISLLDDDFAKESK